MTGTKHKACDGDDEDNVRRATLLVLLEEGNEVGTVLGLLHTSEDHLGTRDHLLGVLEVLEERLLSPGDTGVGVSSGVSVALTGTSGAADDTSEVGTLLALALSSNDRVALEAELLEEGSTLDE